MDEVLMAIGCIDDFELEEVDDDDPTIKRLKESHQLYIDIQKTVWGAQEGRAYGNSQWRAFPRPKRD